MHEALEHAPGMLIGMLVHGVEIDHVALGILAEKNPAEISNREFRPYHQASGFNHTLLLGKPN